MSFSLAALWRFRCRTFTSGRRFMSVRPHDAARTEARKKVTIQSLHVLRQSGTPITMLTAYDYPTALACSANSSLDITLVGDSLAQTCLGYSSTTHLTLSEMIHHARAVSRGTTHPLLIADMPFGSYHPTNLAAAVSNAVQLVRDGRVDGVKLEGGEEIVGVVKALTQAGIPVMAHVGLLPQRHTAMSGYRVQGRDREGAWKVVRDAEALQAAGAFSTVVEAVPKELGKFITDRLSIPTIGIGAGPWTNGQVLVFDDIMGTYAGHKAKFVRRFVDVKSERQRGVLSYIEAVRASEFPDVDTESYTMEAGEWEAFLAGETEKKSR